MNLHTTLLLVVFLIVCVFLLQFHTCRQAGDLVTDWIKKRHDSDAKMVGYPRMEFERFTGEGCCLFVLISISNQYLLHHDKRGLFSSYGDIKNHSRCISGEFEKASGLTLRYPDNPKNYGTAVPDSILMYNHCCCLTVCSRMFSGYEREPVMKQLRNITLTTTSSALICLSSNGSHRPSAQNHLVTYMGSSPAMGPWSPRTVWHIGPTYQPSAPQPKTNYYIFP